MVNICPNPGRWREIYERLLPVCRQRNLPLPPRPLILNGWVYTNDVQKAEIWAATVKWAASHGVSDLVVLDPSDWSASRICRAMKSGHSTALCYLPWRFEASPRPSPDVIQGAIYSSPKYRTPVADGSPPQEPYPCPPRATSTVDVGRAAVIRLERDDVCFQSLTRAV